MNNIRLLRGRTLIRPCADGETGAALKRAGLIAPATLTDDPRSRRGNQNSLGRGVVIAMGAPAMSRKGGAEVAPGHAIGDEVLFIGQGRARVVEFDGELLRACAHEEVVAVISGCAS